MDLSPAAAYGNIEVLLEPGPVALSSAPMMRTLKKKLKNFSDNDFLVAVGDPSAIAGASMVASLVNNGRVNLLKWDKKERSYIQINLEV
jgi:hypothetical protein